MSYFRKISAVDVIFYYNAVHGGARRISYHSITYVEHLFCTFKRLTSSAEVDGGFHYAIIYKRVSLKFKH